MEQLRQVDQNLIFDENLLRQVRLFTMIGGPNALSPEQLDRVSAKLCLEWVKLFEVDTTFSLGLCMHRYNKTCN